MIRIRPIRGILYLTGGGGMGEGGEGGAVFFPVFEKARREEIPSLFFQKTT